MKTFKRLISKFLDILIPERVLYRKKLNQLEFEIFPSISKKIDEITTDLIDKEIKDDRWTRL
jgi:vacuolar-type H+-ATPase subunit D/Vma8